MSGAWRARDSITSSARVESSGFVLSVSALCGSSSSLDDSDSQSTAALLSGPGCVGGGCAAGVPFARVISNIIDANVKAPTVVVSKGSDGAVALTHYRGLQFSPLYLRHGESLPHVIGEGKERVIRRSSDRLGHRHIGLN